MHRLRFVARYAALGALLTLVACAKGESEGARRVKSTESRIVGPAGGQVVGDSGATVVLPAGAVGGDVTIAVSGLAGVRPPRGAAIVGEPVRLGPEGTMFMKGVEVLIPITPTALGGKSLDDVVVVRSEQDSDVFVPIPTRRAPQGGAVIAVTEHFSDFIPLLIDDGVDLFGACGDQICGANEGCVACPVDCGVCLGASTCGNGVCEFTSNYSEDCGSCVYDCGECGSGACGDGIIDPNETCDPAVVGGTPSERCDCTDPNPCIPDTPVMGSAQTCDAICSGSMLGGFPYTTCDDGLVCTVDVTVSGTATACDLSCTNAAFDTASWAVIGCDDGNACTADSLVSYDPTNCDTECDHALDGECLVPGCGNGTVDAALSEACDDGNIDDGDGCSRDCLTIEPGFTCDAFGYCAPICGDLLILGNETCEDGNINENDGCSSCQILGAYDCPIIGQSCVPNTCGDSTVDAGEACDDGNTNGGDGCNRNCTTIEPGYICPVQGMPCNEFCGDSVVTMSEYCDDGGLMPGDGCDATCVSESGWVCPSQGGSCAPYCGDGILTGPEVCDENWFNQSAGCPTCDAITPGWACPSVGSSCHPITCGDGVVDAPEICDEGPGNATPGCQACMTITPTWFCRPENQSCRQQTCGDGYIDGAEMCDEGPGNQSAGCPDCLMVTPGWNCPMEGFGCSGP